MNADPTPERLGPRTLLPGRDLVGATEQILLVVGRLGEPMEIGASVLYLASPSASFVTGHVLDVNGGMAM